MLEQWRSRWAESVRCNGHRTALLAPQGRLSFTDLDRLAEPWKQHYEAQPDWRVGRCVAVAWQVAYTDLPHLLGLWLAGGCWIACSPESKLHGLAQRLETCVTGPPQGNGIWQSLLFSSGSSGPAKLLVRGWRQALCEADAYALRLGLPAGSCGAMLIHAWFGASTKQLLAGLLQGWTLALGPGAATLLGGEGDVLYGTPSQLQALGAATPGVRGFQWISLTGEACPASLWPVLQSWGQPAGRCLNALGASETGVIAEQVLSLDKPWQPFVGVPVAGKRVDLVGEGGGLLTRHHSSPIGRLRVQGPALIEGELRQDDPAGPWRLQPLDGIGTDMQFVSHDLARWDPSGGVELLGRSNALFKRHGEWMDASPLQSWFESQPEVRRCQLMAESKDLVAWLQLDAATPELLRRLSARLEREGLDPRLAPRRLYGLQHFPLNANGKVDLAALQEAASDPLHIKAVSWDPDEGAPAIGIELDSLDQAQLLTQWRRTNLLWCGGGLNALGTDCPAGLGLLKLAFPEPHEGEKAESKRCMADLAKEQVEELLALKDGDLGDQIWLGGFSMAAWWAYALAWELEQRGQPVRGVILLDPVNPYSSVYRWCWRRWLADQWRKDWGSRFYRDLDRSQRAKKGMRQTLLGKWQVKALGNATLLVLQSRWRRHLPRQRAQALAKVVEVMTLDTHSHESVLTHPEIVAAWRHRVREWIGYGR